jgi:hypothetical protein
VIMTLVSSANNICGEQDKHGLWCMCVALPMDQVE